MDRQKCECCGRELAFRWCDTHGVGVCVNCGLPYTIYHYENVDGVKRRVDKPPSVALSSAGVEIARRYWTEEHRRVFPATYDMGIGRSGLSYSGASEEDCVRFRDWYEGHKHEFAA